MRSTARTTTRRFLAVLVTLLVVATATVAGPAAATDKDGVKLKDYIQIRTKKTAAVVVGDTAWVTVSIRGKKDLENVRFTAQLKGGGGAVEYPANTIDHSGPYNDYELDKKETDYVAFRLTIPEGFSRRDANLELAVTFTHKDKRLSSSGKVKIPVVKFDGSPYTLVSDEVTLAPTANGWVEVSFAGLAPRLEGFEVKIVDPSGLDVHYPLESYTSLAGDSLLEDGETDVVRFRLGESLWGTPLDVELEVKYLLESVSKTASHNLAIIPA